MKATLWLWTVVMALVCVSLQVSALPYSDSRVVQENSLLSLKRTKPSLSIVNPLDVLRQRIILEMARRQMRENTRQVELNKALLREIGKRSSNLYDGSEYPRDYTYYDRKLYNQRVAATEPDRRTPTEADEVEAIVESLLRQSHLARREASQYAGKLQRPHSINERHTPDQSVGSQGEQSQQSAQLSSLFNNEDQEALKTKDQALRQTLAQAQDQGTGDEDEQPEEPAVSDGSSAQQTVPVDETLPETNRVQGSSDRTNGAEFGPRYVYGMYKNRFAN
uniref:Corticotropin-releasing factor domain-containing protein n=1 Tax=Anopheles farauti TaxID=69004 RepID=A0A182QVY9_9DIPT